MRLLRPQSSASTALLPPPTFRERRHRGLARRLVSVRRAAYVAFVRGPSCKRGGIRHRRGVLSLARQARDPVADLSVKKYRLAVLRAIGCAIATA
jgi:hypothetical protein